MNAPTTQITRSDERQTWLALFLGVVLLFLHQNLVYALNSVSCVWGWFTFTIAGVGGLVVVEAIITLIALALMLIMIYLPWKSWRRFQTHRPTENPHMLQDTEDDQRPLVAFITMLLNGFFLLFIFASLVPIFSLSPCAQA
jgi:uncharacterized membrane protein